MTSFTTYLYKFTLAIALLYIVSNIFSIVYIL